MLRGNCAIKRRMGVLVFNKLSNDHFKNGWHWLIETELLLFLFVTAVGQFQEVLLSQRENQAAKKCECVSWTFEEWMSPRSETIIWWKDAETELRFLQSPKLFPIWKHFIVQARMCESDDLLESKWQSEGIGQERCRGVRTEGRDYVN